jgi:ABC-type phosphate transport system substrate-binding protein
MTSRPPRARWIQASAAIILASALALLTASPAGAVSGHEQIQGSGSSWAALAVQQWITDVSSSMQVVYTPTGSAQGRTDYANAQNDFAVSDIGYQGSNPITGGNDASNRPYAYLPIVGGATAFAYNLVVAGHRVENLRLSGLTLAKIFTDQITNWDNPEITADNNGHALPSIPIIPVIHSEGAGTTYQFTDYLFTEYPALWKAFSSYSFPVEFWPTGLGSQVAENGSDGVMGFIKSAAGQGSIGYDEYAYAIGAQFPVAALENSAGWFTMPDAYDAAVSLTQAHINYDQNPADCAGLGFHTSPCYLLETLNNVYTYNDKRTYPLSSYSYEILPNASNDPTMNTAKRQTLADFDKYSLCTGQSEMAPIGYSPLPINLVEASFQQVGLLQKADPSVDVSQVNPANCNNPTFIPGQPTVNYLAKIAPLPPACAQAGAGPCPGQYAHNGNPINGQPAGITPGGNPHAGSGGSGTGNSGSSGSGGSGASSGTGSGGTGSNNSTGSVSTGSSTNTKGSSHVSTRTGGSTSSSTASAGAASTLAVPQAVATVLPGDHPGGFGDVAAGVFIAVLVVAGLAAPVLVRGYRRMSDRGQPEK